VTTTLSEPTIVHMLVDAAMGMTLDLETRLQNWARCMRVHPARMRCMSIEGRYRSPQRNMWEAPVPALRSGLDMLDAYRIECAVNTLPFPDRLLLRLHYCLRARPQTVRAVLRRHGRRDMRNVDFELIRCHIALQHALEHTQDQNSNTTRTHTRILLHILPNVL